MIEKILISSRKSTQQFHFIKGKQWRELGIKNNNHNALVYSALEFRSAIERYFLETYVMMVENDLIVEDISEKEIHRYKAIKAAIYAKRNKLKLYRFFTFNKLFAELILVVPIKISIPDLGLLDKYRNDLSKYCHMQIDTKQTWEKENWVNNGYDLLLEVERYFIDIKFRSLTGIVDLKSISLNFVQLYESFIGGDLNEKELLVQLKSEKSSI